MTRAHTHTDAHIRDAVDNFTRARPTVDNLVEPWRRRGNGRASYEICQSRHHVRSEAEKEIKRTRGRRIGGGKRERERKERFRAKVAKECGGGAEEHGKNRGKCEKRQRWPRLRPGEEMERSGGKERTRAGHARGTGSELMKERALTRASPLRFRVPSRSIFHAT